MKKLILLLSFLFSTLSAETIELKEGWNLIGFPAVIDSVNLDNVEFLEKATGAGLGNETAFYFEKKYDFSRGSSILGQGYWFKASADTTLEYTKASTLPSEVKLKKGWNLIYPFETLIASTLMDYPEIEKAQGAGVGNVNNFYYEKKYSFGRGETLEGQAYWFKVSADMNLIFTSFDYRAWGIAGDPSSSKAIIRINGIEYTVLVYSKENIEQSNVSILPNSTKFNGTVLSKEMDFIQISSDYDTKEVKLKFFTSDSLFNETTFVYGSDTLVANNDVVNFGNIIFLNPNDYSVPQPENIDGLNPPTSPIF